MPEGASPGSFHQRIKPVSEAKIPGIEQNQSPFQIVPAPKRPPRFIIAADRLPVRPVRNGFNETFTYGLKAIGHCFIERNDRIRIFYDEARELPEKMRKPC